MKSDAPVFTGFVDANGRMTLDFPDVFRRYVAARFTQQVVEVTVTPPGQKRTARQNRGFHAMVSPWAKERGWEIEALKQFLLKKIFGVLEFVTPRTGEVTEVLAEPHTSMLTVAQFCELIEQTLVLAAEDGYVLMAPDEYRRAKEAQARQAARRARRDA